MCDGKNLKLFRSFQKCTGNKPFCGKILLR